jgi:hypothetical protein
MHDEIVTPHEFLASVEAPALKRLADDDSSTTDVLIVVAGFEERTVGVLQKLINNGGRFRVLLVTYEPFYRENRADEMKLMCHDAGIEAFEMTYDRQNPVSFGESVVDNVSAKARILIDVSVMSRLLIVQLIVAFAEAGRIQDCSVAYCEARTYPPTKEEAYTKLDRMKQESTSGVTFLSSGVFEIAVVPELSSATIGSEQTRLIAFPSLDSHHLTSLRAEIQPSRFTFIEGMPPAPANQWRPQAIATLNNLESHPNSERFLTSTLDYRETLERLLDVYQRRSLVERILVAPTGSKMQTVAVGIFRAHLSDVQIVYPIATDYHSPHNYTRGIGAIHSVSLSPFALPNCVIDPIPAE